jgi:hypothetical protein
MNRLTELFAGWHPCATFFSKRLIDGTRSWGVLMRRYVNGQPQYREMTQAEYEDHYY